MDEILTEIITILATPKLKKTFENLTGLTEDPQTKTTVFEKMVNAYSEKIGKVNQEQKADPDEVFFSELTLKLSPVQVFALKETVLRKSFVDNFNSIVKKVNSGSDSFFDWQDLYSTKYAGIFNELDPDTDQDSAILNNMATTLINLFMALVVTNSQIVLDTPVSKQLIKEFLEEQNNPFEPEPEVKPTTI